MGSETYFIANIHNIFAGSVESHHEYSRDEERSVCYAGINNNVISEEKFLYATILNGMETQNNSGNGIAPTDNIGKEFKIRFVEKDPKTGRSLETPTTWLADPMLAGTPEAKGALVFLHPTAKPIDPLVAMQDIVIGDTLKVYLVNGVYVYESAINKASGMGAWMQILSGGGAVGLANMGGWSPLGGVGTAVSSGKNIKGKYNFTWEELLQLVDLNIFEPLLYYIQQHECSAEGCATKNFNGVSHDAFNYCKPGTCGYMGNTSYLPKPLTQHTIGEVMALGKPGAKGVKVKGTGYRLFAAGRYQIIPNTLNSAFERIKGIPQTELYNKRNQDALGIYLVTMKRGTLGKYLLGADVDWKDAGNDLAFEFASIVLQKARTRKGKLIPAYCKYYGGVGVNKQGKANPTDAKAAMDAINKVRQNFDNSIKAKEIRDASIARKAS